MESVVAILSGSVVIIAYSVPSRLLNSAVGQNMVMKISCLFTQINDSSLSDASR